MCGRFSVTTDPAQLRARFGLSESLAVERRYNVAPQSDVLAIAGGPARPEAEALALRWGLVPHWAKDPAIGARMINARSETAARLPAFRDSFERRRCLVIADGFFEWRATPTGKQPYWITRADREPFAFAGLWASWRAGPDAEPLRSCAILTTTASASVAPIHDRMPVILAAESEAAWLDPDADPARLVPLLSPWPDALTDITPVGRAVNDARIDGPECVEPAPVQAELF